MLTWIFRADPKYEEEVSGCTACVGLITDDKIYIVGFPMLDRRMFFPVS
jgi:hypothetical protein